MPTFIIVLSFHFTSDSLFSVYIRYIFETVIQIIKPYVLRNKTADFSSAEVELCVSSASY